MSYLMVSASTPSKFPDKNELKRFARTMVAERMNSLHKDVKHCLDKPYAPFPALLYCMSSVDFLGALVAGQAAQYDSVTAERVRPTPNSLRYMRDFMGYTEEQSILILEIFRHKLVHLAQPSPSAKHNGKIVAWLYEHHPTHKHLLLENAPKDTKIHIKSDWEIPVDQIFTLGITQFMEDIRDSVYRHGRYLDLLESTLDLQSKFDKAVEEMFQS
jgi:hypothetical protein